MKQFNGKAIYNPSGKAGEYSYWACNFFVGCSNGCEYCYCKKGILSGTMGQDKPQLKKCFRDERHALEMFEKELKQNLLELQKHGLFFSFTTDPMLDETIGLTLNAAGIAVNNGVPVKILTKCADWVNGFLQWIENSNSDNREKDWRKDYAFGFTLTGHNELEPGASTNQERIEAMKKLHDAGFRTFASIEPIINFKSSLEMIKQVNNYCDLFKIGLESGKKYQPQTLRDFIEDVTSWTNRDAKIYFKDSLLKQAGIQRSSLPANCVDRDYNIFNNQ